MNSDSFYHQRIRHKHRSAYSGGGSYAGHDGSHSIAGIKSVDIDFKEIPEVEMSKVSEKFKIPQDRDPYARKCDFYGELKLVN